MTTSEIRDAIREPLTLGILASPSELVHTDKNGNELSREPGNGMGWNYAKDFVVAMVDYICNSYQRKDPMQSEERKELADLILRRNQHFTISDCRVFADMVITGEINTGTGGKDEYRLIDVNKTGILDKLRVYKVRRGDVEQTYRNMQSGKKSRPKKTDKRPLNDWLLHHDYEGHPMPAGWDAYAYWKGIPTEKELDTIILPRIRRSIAGFLSK